MAGWNEPREGAMKSDEEILAELDETMTVHNIGVDKARALLALKSVYAIKDEIGQEHERQRRKFDELSSVAAEAISLVRDLFVAEYSGESQAAMEKRNVLVKHGLIKSK